MGRDWNARPAPAKTSLTEIARRYYASAVALAQTLGLSLEAVLTQHRESVTAVFIEASRAGVRLPAGTTLPPLVVTAPVVQANGPAVTPVTAPHAAAEPDVPDTPPPPTTVPDGWPCRGQAIATLKPAALAMLLSKVAHRVHEEGEAWVPLLAALQAERAQRVEAGRKRPG